MCRLLPCPRGLPQTRDGSASASHLSRPAQTSFALRPDGSLNRPRRPLSRGSNPTGYPVKSLVSYQINRQLSGWNLPPLMIHAFGAHPSFPHSSCSSGGNSFRARVSFSSKSFAPTSSCPRVFCARRLMLSRRRPTSVSGAQSASGPAQPSPSNSRGVRMGNA